ncbi:uncharacterized protein LOC121887310 [Thunnus maccoyii]|uniref:uncharacterized protein LOC121887310 n=1 Tax=Thunnus maccoyii TaxID=8240 RepID=UPI001C4CB17A|nr:uncharacterized protein LOC121887310 [Thunnus maccoyii]
MDHLLMVLVLLWSSGLQAEDKHQPTGSQCESTAKADIVLLVCESRNTTSEDHENIKSFLTQIVNNFNIGPDKVQIGLLQYADRSVTQWYLNAHQTKQSLLEAIANLPQRGGDYDYYTGRALSHIQYDLFQPNKGMRSDSQKILILITDGESEDDVSLDSQRLRDDGIEIYTIGVKNVNETQLRTIASDPDEIHMFSVIDSSFLLDIVANLTINLCNSANSLELLKEPGKRPCFLTHQEASLVEVLGRSCPSLIHRMDPLRDFLVRVFTVVAGVPTLPTGPTGSDANVPEVPEDVGLTCSEPVRLVGGASRCAGTLEVKRTEWRPVRYSDWTLKEAADSVRLVNGTSLCSGRLEVKSEQSWSSVCEADFDQQDAEVVCRELGCGAPSVLQGALYGEVEAPMWTKEFQCGGHESALLDCGRSDSARSTCSPGKAVGLTCSEPVRLVGGASRCAGTLEMKQGEWRPVWDSDWTPKEAAAACRNLDCGSAVSIGSRNEASDRPVWLISSYCVHSGSALRDCASSSSSSSIMELTCSDLLVQPIISVSSTMDRVSEAQQQGFRVRRGSDFTISCSVQPQYPGGSFQLTFTSSNMAHNYTQPAVSHSADFLFPAADPAHQGNYSCVYGVYVFAHNFSSESRLLSLTVTGKLKQSVKLSGTETSH